MAVLPSPDPFTACPFMNKEILSVLLVLIWLSATVVSFKTTIPFITRYRERHIIWQLRITNLVSPYFDVYEAIHIAHTRRDANLPGMVMLQAALLTAFPVLLVFYLL